MADRIALHEALDGDGHAQWVSAPQYADELPEPDHAQYLLERTTSGLLAMTVRGYNFGKPFEVVQPDAGSETLVMAEREAQLGGMYVHGVLGFGSKVMLIENSDTADAYARAMTQVEKGPICRPVQIFERNSTGVWHILEPGLDSFPEPVQELIYGSPAMATLRSLTVADEPPEPVRIENDGPLYSVVPYGRQEPSQIFHSVRDRIGHFPVAAVKVREFDRAARQTVRVATDIWAYGAAPTPATQ